MLLYHNSINHIKFIMFIAYINAEMIRNIYIKID